MTVEPGSYCIRKEFHSAPLEKIRRLRDLNRTISIEVDGCMNLENANLAREAGANEFASGSYLFTSQNISRAIQELADVVM